MVDPNEIQNIIRHVLKEINAWSRAAENLVLLTGMVESNYQEMVQGSSMKGTARSFWQVEPFTAIDNFRNYLDYSFKKDIKEDIMEVSNITEVPMEKRDMRWLLTSNIAFAICMCRITYYRVPEKIPHDSIESLGQYWKKHYNTVEGAGSVEKFVERAEQIANLIN